jgi:hypothetical protein
MSENNTERLDYLIAVKMLAELDKLTPYSNKEQDIKIIRIMEQIIQLSPS